MSIVQLTRFSCDDCGRVLDLSASGLENARQLIRALGWAIARDRITCYCPSCAQVRRNVGRSGSAALKDKLTELRRGFPELSVAVDD